VRGMQQRSIVKCMAPTAKQSNKTFKTGAFHGFGHDVRPVPRSTRLVAATAAPAQKGHHAFCGAANPTKGANPATEPPGGARQVSLPSDALFATECSAVNAVYHQVYTESRYHTTQQQASAHLKRHKKYSRHRST
jgi:hypothetical protein